MKKILMFFLLTVTSLYSDYTRTKIQDYVNIVATQNNINIVTDKDITKEFDFYINKKINGSTNLNVLRDLLKSNGYLLIKKSENYYTIKANKDLLINKMQIFNVTYADTNKVKQKAEEILKGYFKNVVTYKDTSTRRETTPYKERQKGAADKAEIKEIEKRINYSVNILDNKSIAVTYKDEFVPQVVKAIIEKMDKKPHNIRVSIKISEVKKSALKELGTQFDIKIGTKNNTINSNSSAADGIVNLALKTTDYATGLIGVDLGAAITALQSQGKSKVISQPSVLIYEGNSATLKDGKTFPIRNTATDTTNSNTTNTTTNYTKESTGLTITLKFKQMRCDLIFLNMSLFINLVQNYDINLQQLTTIDRELKNDMMIRPGQKVEIAGLTSKVKSDNDGGIPLLMDIPYLGKIFKYDKNIDNETILVMELVAEVVE